MDLLGKKRSTGSNGNGASTGMARTYDPSCNFGDSISGKGDYAFGSGSSRDLDLNDLNCVGKGGLDLNYPMAVNDDDGNVNLDHKVANIRACIDLNVDVNDCGVFRDECNVNERKGHCFDLNLELGEENLDLNEGEGLDLNHVSKGGLDLNHTVLVIDDDYSLKEGNKLGKSRDEIFDLNVNVNGDDCEGVRDEGGSNERKGHCFDLNLELGEDINCEDLVRCEVAERNASKFLPNHEGSVTGLKPPSRRRGRKRMFSDTDTKAVPESGLRRSTRRGRKSALVCDVVKDLSSPKAGEVTGVSETSKAESSENYQCGHCYKDVLIRDAVSCQYCKGSFHKRHVRKTSGSVTAPSTYSCHKCGANSRVLSVASQKIKKVSKERNVAGGSKVVQGNKQSRKNQMDKNATMAGPVRRSLKKTRTASLQTILRRTEPINGCLEENQGMEHEGNH